MSDRPPPLTPPECDLQDFPFMPLHVARLRDSDLASEESPEACWYAVLLWAAAWHQLPAGSLPDSDLVLAKLAGLGRDVRTFRKHRAGALRGFILCSDGRLYHPVVAEQVVQAWDGKLHQRWRTECARIKKQNQRTEGDTPLPTFEEWLSHQNADPGPPPVPEDVPEDNQECPPGNGIQEKGTGTGKGTERLCEGAPRKRGSRLPEDWQPSDALIAYGMGLRFTDAEVRKAAERFKLHWGASAGRNAVKLNWDMAFQGWLRDDRERKPLPKAPTGPRVW